MKAWFKWLSVALVLALAAATMTACGARTGDYLPPGVDGGGGNGGFSISGAGGIQTGLTLSQTGTLADGDVPVALTGRVWCWCSNPVPATARSCRGPASGEC